MRLSVRAVVPLLGAIPLAGAIAGASYALQSSLNHPPPGSTLATVLVARLERLGEMRTLEIVPGRRNRADDLLESAPQGPSADRGPHEGADSRHARRAIDGTARIRRPGWRSKQSSPAAPGSWPTISRAA